MKSQFLCTCGNLIYSDSVSKKDFCINSSCKNYEGIKLIYNKKEGVESEFQKIIGSVKLNSKLLSKNFIRFLFTYQNNLFLNLYGGKGAPIKELLIINYLIALTKNIAFVGRNNSDKKFIAFIQSITKKIDNYFFYQDLKQENWVLADIDSRKAFPLKLKYLEEINSQKNNYGLVSDIKSPKNFRFNSIDLENIEKKAFKIGDNNLEEYFLQFFPEMIKIEMLTKYNLEFSKMFKRKVDRYSIAGLASLFFSSKENKNLTIIKKEEFHRTLLKMSFTEKQILDFFSFLIGDESQIPLIIVEEDYIVYGKWSIFTYMLNYLGSIPEYHTISIGKSKASLVFERKIREFLREKNYLVPFDEEFKLKKISLANDIIAINPDKKQIIIIEAKYRDLPSSAFSGVNLRNIKLNDLENGEINLVKRQIARKKEIMENIDLFNDKCKEKGFNLDFKSYSIIAKVILKFKPLIGELDNVELLSFDELNEYF